MLLLVCALNALFGAMLFLAFGWATIALDAAAVFTAARACLAPKLTERRSPTDSAVASEASEATDDVLEEFAYPVTGFEQTERLRALLRCRSSVWVVGVRRRSRTPTATRDKRRRPVCDASSELGRELSDWGALFFKLT